ncbi:MAG: DUF3107 domain-containing protein [Acidimicrobiales bacterium]
MEVRIGVTQSPREIEVDLGDDADAAAVAKQVEDAVNGDVSILWLTDRKGRRVGVSAAKLAYVEIGSPADERRVGFGAHVGAAAAPAHAATGAHADAVVSVEPGVGSGPSARDC